LKHKYSIAKENGHNTMPYITMHFKYLAFHSKQQSVVTTTGPVQPSHLVLVVYQDFWNLWDYLAKL
jgi:hypothetical protein